jgi:integrase/recombinase XerD
MSEVRERMVRDLRLAGLEEKTSKEYLRAVRQLAAYYMIRPDQLTERQVEDYLLYVRDELGAARGTFAPLLAGLKFFYVNTLGYDWPLLTKKEIRRPRQKRLPDVRSDADCRRLIGALKKPIYRGLFTLIYAYGLRINAAAGLPVTAVASDSMTLRIIGKGNKERIR